MAYLIHFSDGSDVVLAHHGILGQKWGIRRYQNEDGSYKPGARGRYDQAKANYKEAKKQYSRDVKNAKKEYKQSDEYKAKQKETAKKVAIGAAAIAGTALAAYGAYKLNDVVLNKAFEVSKQRGEASIKKILEANLDSPTLTSKGLQVGTNYLTRNVEDTARQNSSTLRNSIRTLSGRGIKSDAELTDMGIAISNYPYPYRYRSTDSEAAYEMITRYRNKKNNAE